MPHQRNLPNQQQYSTDQSGVLLQKIEELTHGNKKKTDRVVWALQGRFEHGKITLNKGEWNATFLDELFQFPNQLVHDDLIDSLAYIDQLANIAYTSDYVEEDYEFLDTYAGY